MYKSSSESGEWRVFGSTARTCKNAGVIMRKLAVALLLMVSCQLLATPQANALDRSTTRVPRHARLAIATKSHWVPMVGDSHFKVADNMIATLFVEKGSLVEYKQTGVWPQNSSFLLRLKQVPTTDNDATNPQRTLVVDIAYKNNPATQQWESYAVSCRYDIASNNGKNPTSYRCKALHAGCSQRPAEETPENGGPDFL
jgi:hypothetical protein